MPLMSPPIAAQSLISVTTILIVEDSKTDRTVYIRYLRADSTCNYEILEAETLEEGLEIWRSQDINLVILDINLPDGQGLELLETIKESYLEPKLPVIVITGQGDKLLALEAMKLGASDYLAKKNITAISLSRSVANVISQLTLTQKLRRLQTQESIITQISLNIHQSLNLKTICQKTVTDVRNFLESDRVIIYQFNSNTSGQVLAASVIPPWQPYLQTEIIDSCLQEKIRVFYQDKKTFACSDIYTANLTDCHRQLLESFQVRANLVVPIFLPKVSGQSSFFWGLLISHQCSGPRIWQDTDLELFQRLAVQLAIAIQQAELYQNLQSFNLDLEEKVKQRTKEVQTLLEQSQQAETNLKLQARILDEIYDAVISTNFDGIIQSWNNGATKLFAYQPEEMIGQNVRILGDEAFQVQPQMFGSLLKKGEYEVEAIIISKFGERRDISLRMSVFLDEQGNVLRLLGCANDISDHKQTEAEIKEFNRRWRSVLNNIQMIVIELDQDGNIEYVNPFFQKISEFTAEEVIGKHWLTNFAPPDLLLSLENTFQEHLKEVNNEYFVHPILNKSGEEQIIGWRNCVLKNNLNQSIGTILIGENITEKIHLERIKSEFLSIVSHELKTPLTSIQASLSLLSQKIIDPVSEAGEELIEIATDGIDHLVRLVNDILDAERLVSGKFYLKQSDCNTQKIMKAAIAQFQELAKQADIKINLNPASFSLFADADRLVQVLINLLSNAIKFSSKSTTIDLSVEEQKPESWNEINSQTYLLFIIRDRGRGIPPQNLESIFERFHQVDSSDAREQGGTGLGLAICREIVEQHGGKIWVESVLGQGSTFYFTINCHNN